MRGLLHDDYLAALAFVTEEASAGPWYPRLGSLNDARVNLSTGPGMLLEITGTHHTNIATMSRADAEFVAAARTAVPLLLAEIRRLRALLSLSDREALDGAE
jgi:hypothetical protein